MVEKSELLHVPVFAGLPDDQIEWFVDQVQEMSIKRDEMIFRQGDPADAMFVFLSGQLQVRGELGGETVVIQVEPGAEIGRAHV